MKKLLIAVTMVVALSGCDSVPTANGAHVINKVSNNTAAYIVNDKMNNSVHFEAVSTDSKTRDQLFWIASNSSNTVMIKFNTLPQPTSYFVRMKIDNGRGVYSRITRMDDSNLFMVNDFNIGMLKAAKSEILIEYTNQRGKDIVIDIDAPEFNKAVATIEKHFIEMKKLFSVLTVVVALSG